MKSTMDWCKRGKGYRGREAREEYARRYRYCGGEVHSTVDATAGPNRPKDLPKRWKGEAQSLAWEHWNRRTALLRWALRGDCGASVARVSYRSPLIAR